MRASQLIKLQLHRRSYGLLALLVVLLSVAGNICAAGDDGRSYLPSDDVLADVAAARESAAENDKLMLVIMGANWCHDSRALAARVHREPLKELMARNYETVFVDVGFQEIDPEIVQKLGIPVYYATPTVLIIDPVSGRVVNAGNRHQWASADSISMEDTLDYFRSMAETGRSAEPENGPVSDELQSLLDQIDAFEKQQAERVYAAYGVTGPMLRAYKAGNAPSEFNDYWDEVWEFRKRVPVDLEELRAEAHRRAESGETNIQLDYPQYPPFSWE